MARKGDGFAEDVGIGVEAGFPDAMTEDDDGRILFVGTEAAAEGQAELGDVEEIGGSSLAPEALGIPGAGDGGGKEVVEEWPGEVVATFVVIGGVKGEERWRVADGSGVENEARDHGENGGVGAN